MTTPEILAIAATVRFAAAQALSGRPPLAAVWGALARVPDPEIPVVSVVELGVVRDVHWEDGVGAGALVVRVTPTYSGCPATDLIRDGIGAALREIGVAEVRIVTALAPAWTTDWIAPEAKARLLEYGIAPPGTVVARVDMSGISPLRRKAVVPCPRCASTSTTLIAQFGSTACKALYRCDSCREPFDYFKPF